ncbi:hypothetical protein Sjap_024938 [Stephania japonica]|uniref:Glycosyltransferase n=1 Tax=Stephania japonica TaxID=461633 RepID=A0AAP0EE93_9MAGN
MASMLHPQIVHGGENRNTARNRDKHGDENRVRDRDTNSAAHVLIFPLPYQGHVNSMLKLAELLSIAGLRVTFLNSDYNQHRLLSHSDVLDRFSRFPAFQFQTISDGIPLDNPRSAHQLLQLFNSLNTTTKHLFRDRLLSLYPRPSSIIVDGAMTFAIDIAKELGLPIFAFRTISACAFWAYFCLPRLLQSGELPFDDDDMDKPIKSVPGMESFLRRRDLPSFCRARDLSDPILQRVMTETLNAPRATALILNTMEELEGPILSQIRSHCPNLYTVGPLHALLNNSQSQNRPPSQSGISSNSLWAEQRSCIKWLDSHPTKSVVYVSFGSLAVVRKEEMVEFWHGLVKSEKPFLWVVRPGLVGLDGAGAGAAAAVEEEELVEGTRQRGCLVEWAPQEEVLNHRAVGAFLTHSGWNSTLEGVFARVPMICWPYFADQQMNSRFVSEVWGVGVDMKDECERGVVERMVREVMDEGVRRDELRRRADEVGDMAATSVGDDGSSFCDLGRLVQDLRHIGLSRQ